MRNMHLLDDLLLWGLGVFGMTVLGSAAAFMITLTYKMIVTL